MRIQITSTTGRVEFTMTDEFRVCEYSTNAVGEGLFLNSVNGDYRGMQVLGTLQFDVGNDPEAAIAWWAVRTFSDFHMWCDEQTRRPSKKLAKQWAKAEGILVA